jgi:DNA polymerase (family 10)
MSIEGMGAKTVNMLWKERGITSLDALENALATDALKGVKGLGEKKLASMKAGIEHYKSAVAGGGVQRRTGIPQATEYGEALVTQVRKIKGVVRAELAGSLRRRRERLPTWTSSPPSKTQRLAPTSAPPSASSPASSRPSSPAPASAA